MISASTHTIAAAAGGIFVAITLCHIAPQIPPALPRSIPSWWPGHMPIVINQNQYDMIWREKTPQIDRDGGTPGYEWHHAREHLTMTCDPKLETLPWSNGPWSLAGRVDGHRIAAKAYFDGCYSYRLVNVTIDGQLIRNTDDAAKFQHVTTEHK